MELEKVVVESDIKPAKKRISLGRKMLLAPLLIGSLITPISISCNGRALTADEQKEYEAITQYREAEAITQYREARNLEEKIRLGMYIHQNLKNCGHWALTVADDLHKKGSHAEAVEWASKYQFKNKIREAICMIESSDNIEQALLLIDEVIISSYPENRSMEDYRSFIAKYSKPNEKDVMSKLEKQPGYNGRILNYFIRDAQQDRDELLNSLALGDATSSSKISETYRELAEAYTKYWQSEPDDFRKDRAISYSIAALLHNPTNDKAHMVLTDWVKTLGREEFNKLSLSSGRGGDAIYQGDISTANLIREGKRMQLEGKLIKQQTEAIAKETELRLKELDLNRENSEALQRDLLSKGLLRWSIYFQQAIERADK